VFNRAVSAPLILWRKRPEFEYDSERSFHAWQRTIFLNRHQSRRRHQINTHANSRGCGDGDQAGDGVQREVENFVSTSAGIAANSRVSGNSVRILEEPCGLMRTSYDII
jgi:DNA-directed RNA polymerase specialized sigma24 family protein